MRGRPLLFIQTFPAVPTPLSTSPPVLKPGRLTRDTGVPLASLPLDPPLAASLLAACRRYNVADHLLLLCGLLSVPAVWAHAGGGGKRARDAAVQKFAAAEGDLVTYLNAHRAWAENGRSHKWWVV